MEALRSYLVPTSGVVGLFVAIQLGAVALIEPFVAADIRAVEDPTDPTNSLLILGALLVVTAGMLVAIRYRGLGLLRWLIIAIGGGLSFLVVETLLTPLAGALAAGGVVLGLAVYPEWYVIDTAGVLIGAGAAAVFGASFGPLPAILFLLLLAVYDAISVYGTEHMLTLADNVMDMRVPVVLVVPTTWSYTFLEAPESTVEGRRDAIYIGLGDAVMPTVLTTTAIVSHDLGTIVGPLSAPAIGALIGTVIGLLVLLALVFRGRAHAGLPLLNGGAIAGYLIGATGAGLTLTEAVGLAG